MRCPDCNKFVSFDTDGDAEIDLDVSEDGQVSGTVRFTNNCAECSQELKEGNLDVEVDLSELIAAHREEHKDAPAEHDSLEVDHDGGSRLDEMQTKDRRGKPIRNPRYMKHLYGVSMEITVTCKCGETFTASWEDKLPGSAMEELV